MQFLLPQGLVGLVFAGLLAALMSSLSSVFNSCSTLVTFDIYKKLHPEASDRTLVRVGQIATGVLVLLGLAWIPFMKYISDALYEYLQSVQAYISPPVAAVFLIGVCWKRVNSRGAIVSLVTGFILGMGRLFVELKKADVAARWGEDSWLYQYADINFMHMAILLFVICSAVLIVVSLMTRPEGADQLRGLTMQTLDPEAEEAVDSQIRPARRRKQIIASVILCGLVVVVWIYFSG
jgi:SSS family solute:Na+ symporter